MSGTVTDVLTEAVGLQGFGRPDGYASRQLRRWSTQWVIVGMPSLAPLAAEAIDRLSSALPEQQTTVLVHGDYRTDNTLWAADDPLAAVVDWELSTVGDPVADVATMCAYRHPAFDHIAEVPSAWTSPQIWDIDELAAAYEAAGGRPSVDWQRHLALAGFKIAVIAAGIDHRRRAGAASGSDTAGEAVEPFLEFAMDALR